MLKQRAPMRSRLRPLAYATLIVFTVVSFIAITFRLRLDPNVSALLPDSGNGKRQKRSATMKKSVRAISVKL